MSKKKISGKRLVIQFGRYMTQIVLVNGKGHIQHAATVSTPLGAVEDGMIQDMDAIRDMLKEALRASEFKRTYEVIFTLSTSQVISETVVVPDMPAARLEKLLDANVDMYFPVDMRDYQMVWQAIGPVDRDNGMKE
jgi:Tfp pilus assembly PilM family ATPase